MHVVLQCATRRGYQFLKKLIELLPDADLTVFSFPEEPWEPPFLKDILELSRSKDFQFVETRQVHNKSLRQFWEGSTVDLMFAVSWRYLIPERIYSRSRLGTFVFHDSLLPEYRGFSPTVWAMINGEDHTGVTLFEMAEATDSGDIVDQEVLSNRSGRNHRSGHRTSDSNLLVITGTEFGGSLERYCTKGAPKSSKGDIHLQVVPRGSSNWLDSLFHSDL